MIKPFEIVLQKLVPEAGGCCLKIRNNEALTENLREKVAEMSHKSEVKIKK
jgi:hypothetical protein